MPSKRLLPFLFVSLTHAETLTKEEECKVLPDLREVGSCLTTVRSGRPYFVSLEKLELVTDQLAAQKQIKTSTPLIIDTIAFVNIEGEDTTKTLYIAPRNDTRKAEKDLNSMAGSLRFMAVVSGLALAASIVSIVVVIVK